MRDPLSGIGKLSILFALGALGAMFFAPATVASPVMDWVQSRPVQSQETATGVFWQAGSSATLNTDAMVAGGTMDVTSVSLDPRARILYGSASGPIGAARAPYIRISSNRTGEDLSSNYVTPVPEPASLLLLGAGLLALAASRKKSQKT